MAFYFIIIIISASNIWSGHLIFPRDSLSKKKKIIIYSPSCHTIPVLLSSVEHKTRFLFYNTVQQKYMAVRIQTGYKSTIKVVHMLLHVVYIACLMPYDNFVRNRLSLFADNFSLHCPRLYTLKHDTAQSSTGQWCQTSLAPACLMANALLSTLDWNTSTNEKRELTPKGRSAVNTFSEKFIWWIQKNSVIFSFCSLTATSHYFCCREKSSLDMSLFMFIRRKKKWWMLNYRIFFCLKYFSFFLNLYCIYFT